MTSVGVCGFGRCGSTMLMAMLDAGGIYPAGDVDSRSYELTDAKQMPNLPADVLAGRSIKLLDAVLYGLVPRTDGWRFIWLDRQPHQQAKSQVKFFRGAGHKVPARTVKTFEASYERDRPRALARLVELGRVHIVSYEAVLADPLVAAHALATFLAPDLRLDAAAAATVVHARGARCVDGLTFESTGAHP
jgi:hypothetical protein